MSTPRTPIQVLRTSRLELRRIDARIARADASNRALLPALLDACVPPEWPPPLLADHLEQFARDLEADPDGARQAPFYWILLEDPAAAAPAGPDPTGKHERSGRVLIGNGGFFDLGDGAWMIGYSVLEAWHHRGYATEAVAALVEYAFSHPQVQTLVGTTYPHLAASIRVMEKNGFRFDGPADEPGVVRYVRRRAAVEGGAAGR